MYAITILYATSIILIILSVATKNKPEKQLARKVWLKIAAMFIVVASVTWMMIT
ncbi:MAG: hypothetical protein ABJK37_12210 [Paraglaciecola sp.]|uniref:hypothetical protein n=1 Tax=Paraglaciecola sp. TaxID=1920173 RepID=UPI0032992C3A